MVNLPVVAIPVVSASTYQKYIATYEHVVIASRQLPPDLKTRFEHYSQFQLAVSGSCISANS